MRNELEGIWKEETAVKFITPVRTWTTQKTKKSSNKYNWYQRWGSNQEPAECKSETPPLLKATYVNSLPNEYVNYSVNKPSLKLNTSYFAMSHSLQFPIQM
jgi:hypothetical protein